MVMGMGFGLEQQMRASPALVALNNMLVLSTYELQQLVQQELIENPALEHLDEPGEISCDICGRTLHEGVCFFCLSSEQEIRAAEQHLHDPLGGEIDPLLQIAEPQNALLTLERDVCAAVREADRLIATYLIGSLDARGFLAIGVEEMAAQLGCEAQRVLAVLHILQEIGPPGVGAADTRESLLLQIDRLEHCDADVELMRCIVEEHWDDFVAHRFTVLARTLGMPYERCLELRDMIRTHLYPYPLAQLGDVPVSGNPLPDVTIMLDGDRFMVEVATTRRYRLRLNPLYQQLHRAVIKGETASSEEESEHLRTYVARARLFLKNMHQRGETIQRISEYVVERQSDFLRHGIRHLQPLTRTEVGAELGLNDSTISRATAHKYVMLPNREVIPFSTFFSASLSVKDVLKGLISAEHRPLTDDELGTMLRERGFQLARRTVAKYRGQLGIPPAALR